MFHLKIGYFDPFFKRWLYLAFQDRRSGTFSQMLTQYTRIRNKQSWSLIHYHPKTFYKHDTSAAWIEYLKVSSETKQKFMHIFNNCILLTLTYMSQTWALIKKQEDMIKNCTKWNQKAISTVVCFHLPFPFQLGFPLSFQLSSKRVPQT